MESFDIFTLARAFHVLAVILWIGGVAFVTTVLIPSLKQMSGTKNKLALFEQLEGRFGFQAKMATVMTGLSGFYMLNFMDAWGRYQEGSYWWIHLMTLVWVLFTVVLFVLEPLILHRWFKAQANKDSEKAFIWLHRMHIILLSLSLLAVFGAVAGSHGFQF
ncbi:MAG: hypothetical protein KAG26_02710 [Methylococcales bacterium]|nr:hypothetical protein [Methylococcales bacterium]